MRAVILRTCRHMHLDYCGLFRHG